MRWPCLLMVLALAGCAGDAVQQPPPEAPEPRPRHDVAGRVLTPAFNPIQGARVWVGQSGHCAADTCTADLTIVEDDTDGDGGFRLPGIWAGDAMLHIVHPDYVARNVSVTVPGPAPNITLVPLDRVVPYQAPMGPYIGFIDCGADHLIFAGGCDEFVGEIDPTGSVEGTFTDEREFFIEVADDWQTIVLDISFGDIPPTLDGLRLAAYEPDVDAALGSYQRYHQAGGAEPFTLRLEPGTDYGDHVPTPQNASTIRLEVFPRGHAYHQVCGDGQCFTGVGASGQIDFEIIATVFYHEAAPPGWTLLPP